MKTQVTCPGCDSPAFRVVLIDGARLVLHCIACSWDRHVIPVPVKLEID